MPYKHSQTLKISLFCKKTLQTVLLWTDGPTDPRTDQLKSGLSSRVACILKNKAAGLNI